MDEYIEKEAMRTIIREQESKHGLRGMAWVEMAMDRHPSADVVPVRHGRWEMRGGKRYCTSCGERACVTRDSEDFWYTIGTPYCPNCGAKMDEEK